MSESLSSVRYRLLGLINEDRIRTITVARPSEDVRQGFLALEDMCSTASDAMDEIGVRGCIGSLNMHPVLAGLRLCGPAITIRYAPERADPTIIRARGERAKLADRDLYGVGSEGDVGVFDCEGSCEASVMGSLSALWAQRLGIAGCVVDGAIRDVEGIREQRLPVWSRATTPVSGKYRMEAVEINGTVSVGGIQVRPGDLILADDTGICVVPLEYIDEVLRRCREIEEAERSLVEAMKRDAPVSDIVAVLRPERW